MSTVRGSPRRQPFPHRRSLRRAAPTTAPIRPVASTVATQRGVPGDRPARPVPGCIPVTLACTGHQRRDHGVPAGAPSVRGSSAPNGVVVGATARAV